MKPSDYTPDSDGQRFKGTEIQLVDTMTEDPK
jgi:hypothetical protein